MSNTKLTSVKIIKNLYDSFKLKTVNTDMTLEKLTNRCVDLYIHNEEFRDMVGENEHLKISGSSL